MDWRSHVAAGVILSLVAVLIFGTRDIITLVVLGAIGGLSALVPDLDHDSSKGKQMLDVAFAGFAMLSAVMSGCGKNICIPTMDQLATMATVFFALIGTYFAFFMFLKPNHRGITHTLAATFVFGFALFLIAGIEVGIAGMFGYFSHLVTDLHMKII